MIGLITVWFMFLFATVLTLFFIRILHFLSTRFNKKIILYFVVFCPFVFTYSCQLSIWLVVEIEFIPPKFVLFCLLFGTPLVIWRLLKLVLWYR